MSFYKIIATLILNMLLIASAISSPFPRGCTVTGFGFSDNNLILNEHGQQTLYLIQNRSGKPVELEHFETKEVLMSPKLHSKLEAAHWSAFASDIENLHFKCFTQDGEETTTLNCSEVLEVCQYPHVKFALSNMGNYWVSTNKDQGQVIRETAAKGIYLRW